MMKVLGYLTSFKVTYSVVNCYRGSNSPIQRIAYLELLFEFDLAYHSAHHLIAEGHAKAHDAYKHQR